MAKREQGSTTGAKNENALAVFEDFKVRRVYDEATETWYFSVVDIIAALIQQPDYQAARNYWKVLKNRLKKEGSQSVTDCNRLKLPMRRRKIVYDGRSQSRDPPPPHPVRPQPEGRAHQTLAREGGVRAIQDMGDPARPRPRLGLLAPASPQREVDPAADDGPGDPQQADRLLEGPRNLGEEEYAILTNIIHQEWRGVSLTKHQDLKGLKTQNLRDHMSEAELIFTALAELSTRQIAESVQATGMPENAAAGKKGGRIAKGARLELEKKTGKSVVTEENFLPPKAPRKHIKDTSED